ncbi:MAG: His/Gly/Thr/Pro-type tRNA ligase C-terminal domain-containing protein, partial [Proteobacteria bacterium]|nr:His/Gly/Thr/Pro-type tRNA ligase C-terminal domain-containing protein [Pseudomonadota bacterium]
HRFICDELCLAVITGQKTPDERFPGSVATHTLEALMQDGKALQVGTSHFLGQNFAKAYQIKFHNKEDTEEYAWTTSWGVSTRLIGGLIMTHGDDHGLVLPPAVAPKQIVILPITGRHHSPEEILTYAQELKLMIAKVSWQGQPVRVFVDQRDLRGGEKKWQQVKKGVPLIIEIGPHEVTRQEVSYLCRYQGTEGGKKFPQVTMAKSDFLAQLTTLLSSAQEYLQKKAKQKISQHTRFINDQSQLVDYFSRDNPAFVLAPWCQAAIKHPLLKTLKITPRVIPRDQEMVTLKEVKGFPTGDLECQDQKCVFTGQTAECYVVFARAY